MKYVSSIILIVALLFSCKSDVETNNQPTSTPEKSSTNTVKSTSQSGARPILKSDTYDGQLLALSRIYLKYNTSGINKSDEIRKELEKVTHKDLEKTKNLIFDITQRSNNLLSKTYLQKPSKKELQALYQIRFINWNSMSLVPVTEAVLKKLDLENVSEADLLTAYYRMLVSPLGSNTMQQDPFRGVNIDLNKLGLSNEQEKGILFYSIAAKFSTKYSRYARSQKDNCTKTKEMSRSFPHINGKNIFEATPPKFKDFEFVMSNNFPTASFSEIHIPSYEKAKKHYLDCKF